MHTDAPFAVANKTHFHDPEFAEAFLAAMAQPDLENARHWCTAPSVSSTSAAAC